jgi:Glycosyltransferase family 87
MYASESSARPAGARAAPLSSGARRVLWLMLVVGVLARLIVAFAAFGDRFDIDSLILVQAELRLHGLLHVYQYVNFPGLYRYPYPPGYFPLIAAAGAISRATGLAFHTLIHVPPILADAGIAWLVQLGLGAWGCSERVRLLAAGLVMGGPVFFVISGYHGQIDSLAFLPAIGALLIWCRAEANPGVARGLAAGALIGLGAAIKTVPIVMVLALLPTARSWRERAALIGAAVAVPALSLAPFALAAPHSVRALFAYQGGAGAGGLSLALQPDLAHFWISSFWQPHVTPLSPSGVTRFLMAHGGLLTAAGLALLGALAVWRRLTPVQAAELLWLGFYAFGTGFLPQYMVWGLPFFLLAGRLRAVAALQLVLVLPLVLFYFGPHRQPASDVLYATVMIGVWAALVIAFLCALRNAVGWPRRHVRRAPPAPARPATR